MFKYSIHFSFSSNISEAYLLLQIACSRAFLRLWRISFLDFLLLGGIIRRPVRYAITLTYLHSVFWYLLGLGLLNDYIIYLNWVGFIDDDSVNIW